MTTELHLEDAKYMKAIIDPMIAVGDDMHIIITKEGFRTYTHAMAKAWAVDGFITSSKFTTLDIDSDEVTYFVKLKDFSDFMKTVQSKEELIIKEDKEESSLVLTLKSQHMVKKMVLRLQTQPEDFRIMEFIKGKSKLPSKSTLQMDLFTQAIKAAELGGTEVTITHKPDQLHFKATENTKSAEVSIDFKDNDKVEGIEFKNNTEQQAMYNLEYLRHVSRVGKADDKLDLYMATDGPIVLLYQFREQAEGPGYGYLGFAIAPRTKDNTPFDFLSNFENYLESRA